MSGYGVVTKLDNGLRHKGGCSRQACICQTPGPICDEFMGSNRHTYCPRCGWERAAHPDPKENTDG